MSTLKQIFPRVIKLRWWVDQNTGTKMLLVIGLSGALGLGIWVGWASALKAHPWPQLLLGAVLSLGLSFGLVGLALERLLLQPLRQLKQVALQTEADIVFPSHSLNMPNEWGQLADQIQQLHQVIQANARDLREAERNFLVMAEGAQVALLVYRGERIVYASPAAEALTGYSNAELVGIQGDQILEAEVLQGIRQFVAARLREFTLEQSSLEGRRNHLTTEITTKAGSRRVEMAAGVTLFERKPAILITLNDVTERHLALQARIAQQVAEQASQAKSELLAQVSHELRTPLTSILGYAQLLQLDDLGTNQQDSLRRIERSSRHLLSLINEVLDLTSLEAGRIQLAPTSFVLDPLVEECMEMFVPLTQTKGVQLDVTGQKALVVYADHKRIKQVLVNLISNAVKYAPKGSSVLLNRHFEDTMIAIRVSNCGPPIPPEQWHRLFQPFERLSNLEEGTGLGLALSKRLVEEMGGSLFLQQSDLERTVFALRVPTQGVPTVANKSQEAMV